ncbi:MAG: RdgB/HAM1 family non-canonical purine NTP pyrophosphatase [Armatimonadetes bacterium]|nr:RdgB/HAM1 family non-canonical purine NTP pyrophosphatase [Armatimonadota bacterium]
MELLIATSNKHKLNEIKSILKNLPLKLLSLKDFPKLPKISEDQENYQKNALKKALEISKITKIPTLADDSGLEIKALSGHPGIYSARFLGNISFFKKNTAILKLLKNTPMKKRGAAFICAAALASPGGKIWTAAGICKGIIAKTKRGKFGFGYDPIFFIPKLNLTMAELPPEIKNKISHRAKALKKIKPILKKLLKNEILFKEKTGPAFS